MLHTPVCGLLGIDVPVVGAPFGPWEEVDLAVAVCEAGGLGSLGTAARPTADLVRQWEGMRERTDRPFAINHTLRPLDEEAFAATLRFRPAAISFHIGVPADLIARAHDAGVLWIQQVMDVRQAEEALAAGADVVVAQGGEAGGNGGWVATMVLVPQVPEGVDADAELAGLLAAVREGGGHEQIPFAGQSVGLVHDVRPAGEVIAGMVAEAGEALAAAAARYSADSSHQ